MKALIVFSLVLNLILALLLVRIDSKEKQALDGFERLMIVTAECQDQLNRLIGNRK